MRITKELQKRRRFFLFLTRAYQVAREASMNGINLRNLLTMGVTMIFIKRQIITLVTQFFTFLLLLGDLYKNFSSFMGDTFDSNDAVVCLY